MKCKLLLVSIGVFVASLSILAQEWQELGVSYAINELSSNSESFGSSNAIDGDYAVVAGTGYSTGQGRVYVLFNNAGVWEKRAILTASDASDSDFFGCSVSISGDNIVVGSYLDDDGGSRSGSAYVFTKPAMGWEDMTETAKLTASDTESDDFFGESVSISGDDIVVGAYGADDGGNFSGVVYIYTKSEPAWISMTETAKLKPSVHNIHDHFGCSVSIYGEHVVVGSEGNDNGGRAYVFTKPETGWVDMTESAKLTASDNASYDGFGSSVCISGDNILVGACEDDANGSNSGSAYIFTKPETAWLDMTETAKITPSDGSVDEYFGKTICMYGDDVLIGLYYDHDLILGNYTGSVYRFTKPETGWETMTETEKITAVDGVAGNYFGRSVGISDDHILIGASGDDENGNSSGVVYSYAEPISGWDLISSDQKIYPSSFLNSINYNYGNSVAMDGNYAVVGTKGYKNNLGCAYILMYTGSQWKTIARLMASDGLEDEYFGNSVALSGDDVVVGINEGSGKGRVYVFTKPETGWEDMTETAVLSPPEGIESEAFGYSVAISDDNAVVSDLWDNEYSGTAYVFTKPETGWVTSSESAKITASDAERYNLFGASISISGDDIVVGAQYDDDGSPSSGSAYIFTKPESGWVSMTETAKLHASDTTAYDFFGRSVSIFEGVVVIGADGDDDNGENSGSAYLFVKPEKGWVNTTETAKLTALDGAADDYFGSSISIFDEHVLIGAYNKDNEFAQSGAAYVYSKPNSGWENMTESFKLSAYDESANDYYGRSVSIYGDRILIGAHQNDDFGGNSGSVYSYNFRDETDPEIACIGDSSLNLTEGELLYTVTEKNFDPSFSDNFSIESVYNSFNNTSTLVGSSLPVGTTTVVWTVTDYSGNSSECQHNVTVNRSSGLESIHGAGISMYPNPTSGLMHVENAALEIQNIQLLDASGKQLVNTQVSAEKTEINLSAFKNGIYIIKLQTATETIVRKIIKE